MEYVIGETSDGNQYDEVLLKSFFEDLARERGQTLDELAKNLTSEDFNKLINLLENELDDNS